MSEEALLVMKMVQEGKLTPEQGVEFLKAVGPVGDAAKEPQTPTPPTPNPSHTNGYWNSVDQMRSAMADMQQKLAEAQAKLSAAAAQQSADEPVGGRPHFNRFIHGLGDLNIPQIIDDAVRGLGAVKSEVVIGAKSAAREAQREARRFRSVMRSGDGLKVNVDVNFKGFSDSFNFSGDPTVSAATESNYSLGDARGVTIVNDFGDVRVEGTSTDGQVHLSVEKQSWASTQEDAQADLDSVRIKDEYTDDGSATLYVASEPGHGRRIRVDVTAQVPLDAIVSVKTTQGDVVCEKLGDENKPGQVRSIETANGNISLMLIRGNGENARPTQLRSATGDISLTQWSGGDLNANTQSGNVSLDVITGGETELRSKSGNLNLKSVTSRGRVSLETHSGNIDLLDLRSDGAFNAKSLSGDVVSKRLTAAEVVLESASGNVTAETSVASQGKVRVLSISGNVKLRESKASELFANSTSGDCSVQEGAGIPVSASSVSGNVKVALPADAWGDASMVTVSGSIKCGFTIPGASESNRYLSGKFGNEPDGSNVPKIALQTVSGDLTLKPVKDGE